MLRRLFAVLAVTVTSVAAVSAQESDSPKYSFYSAVETGYEMFSKTYRRSGWNINFKQPLLFRRRVLRRVSGARRILFRRPHG